MKIDLAIIGGGVVGLWAAKAFAEKFPAWDIALLEKNPFLGEEASSRNSGVLHAGLYYSTGSWKHRLCLAGVRRWRQHPQFLRECGKFLIATEEAELPAIRQLRERAVLNQIPGIRDLTELERQELHAYVHLQDGFFSTATAVIDVPRALSFLADEVEGRGVALLRGQALHRVERRPDGFWVEGSRDSFLSARLLNVAGASGALALRAQLDLPGTPFVARWVKGHYVKLLPGKKFFDRSLLYPMPPADLKSLGVHTCLWPDGSVGFGPDAWDIEKFDHKLAPRLVESMFPSIAKVFKGIDPENLHEDFCGIRAKVTRDGQPLRDFWIESPLPGYAEALGIESPGFTAAPAIAEELVSRLLP